MITLLKAENVVKAYNSHQASENWVNWANENEALNELLIRAMKAAQNV
jgi:hypothetical protein